ncbi:hypothetical protein HZC32_02230 [Candidatus Woesearchaeota archaeon]|nr:hypothetical protein [Candidatus Woesearchaeota archaeon]
MHKVILIIIVILTSSLMSSPTGADLSADITTLDKQLGGEELRGVMGWWLGNERINVYLEDSKSSFYSLITKDKKIVSLTEVDFTQENESNPTLKVFTNTRTIYDLKNSPAPWQSVKIAIQENKIILEPVGFWNKIKFSLTNLLVKICGDCNGDNNTEEKGMEKQEVEEVKKEGPTAEEVEEEEPKVEEKPTKVNAEVKTKEKNETQPEPKTHTVLVDTKGFSPAELNIKAGDTVEWKIVRNGYLHQGMILGTQNCIKIKSKVLSSGESFKWTFDKAGNCTIVDGITTTQIGRILVEP